MKLDCLSNLNGWLVDELNKIVTKQETYEKFMAQRRQQEIAATLGQDRNSVEGLGRPRLEVDSYAHAYWGTRLGFQCWKDPAFLREFERDNEACRVKSTGTRLQVGYGSLSSGCKKTFKKSYG